MSDPSEPIAEPAASSEPPVARLVPGRRVTVRHVVGQQPSGRPLLSDVVGTVEEVGTRVTVRRRDGSVVELEPRSVVLVKVLPDRPHDQWSLDEVERVAATGWQALETERLGDWLLRASGGFTGRANSCLPLGDPGMPVEDAIDAVERWYGERDLPAQVQITPSMHPTLDELLASRGWGAHNAAFVLTADVGAAIAAADVRVAKHRDDVVVDIADAPDAAWLAEYHYRGATELPPVGIQVLTNGSGLGFASLRDTSGTVAIARAAVTGAWVGVTAVEVAARARRRGLATRLMRHVLAWAQDAGARHAYLQVAMENDAGVSLYQHLAFHQHHLYHYRRGASPGRLKVPSRQVEG